MAPYRAFSFLKFCWLRALAQLDLLGHVSAGWCFQGINLELCNIFACDNVLSPSKQLFKEGFVITMIICGDINQFSLFKPQNSFERRCPKVQVWEVISELLSKLTCWNFVAFILLGQFGNKSKTTPFASMILQKRLAVLNLKTKPQTNQYFLPHMLSYCQNWL